MSDSKQPEPRYGERTDETPAVLDPAQTDNEEFKRFLALREQRHGHRMQLLWTVVIVGVIVAVATPFIIQLWRGIALGQ